MPGGARVRKANERKRRLTANDAWTHKVVHSAPMEGCNVAKRHVPLFLRQSRYSSNFAGMVRSHIAPTRLPPTTAPTSAHRRTSAMTMAMSVWRTNNCALNIEQTAAGPPQRPYLDHAAER